MCKTLYAYVDTKEESMPRRKKSQEAKGRLDGHPGFDFALHWLVSFLTEKGYDAPLRLMLYINAFYDAF